MEKLLQGDSPKKTETFGPTSQPAYGNICPSTAVSIFGEWERLPPGQVNLQPEIYNCKIILTEESFHETAAHLTKRFAPQNNAKNAQNSKTFESKQNLQAKTKNKHSFFLLFALEGQLWNFINRPIHPDLCYKQ